MTYLEIVKKLGTPEIDLFATYANSKCKQFVSWHPDPHSVAVDAFTISWKDKKAYLFPPFALIPRILSKIISDKATCILVFPRWESQPWMPKLRSLLISEVLSFKARPNIVLSPFRDHHPLWQQLSLGAAILSGKHLD